MLGINNVIGYVKWKINNVVNFHHYSLKVASMLGNSIFK